MLFVLPKYLVYIQAVHILVLRFTSSLIMGLLIRSVPHNASMSSCHLSHRIWSSELVDDLIKGTVER